ncbi:MAG TPA: YihY/virulence factor BrkB family protein [Flavobacteriaceae bacterium]|nr:YihY/virulence factor BrkB family protein [Flavobacteriaceae bacterium]
MLTKLKDFWGMLKRAFLSWMNNNPWGQSGTVAYYAIFSLPSLLIIIVWIAGNFFGQEAVQGQLTKQIEKLIGSNSANTIEEIITKAALNDNSTWNIIIGISLLLFGATGVFYHLKLTMNDIWNVKAKKDTFLRMVINRLVSFGMVLVFGFLMLISMVISAVLAAFGDYLSSLAPGFTLLMLQIMSFTISFIITTIIFAAIFKLLPDVQLKWRTTFFGAVLTTILFLIGEFLLGYYFGKTNPGSVYGGASTIILILLWVYYTCLILFYGVEFTVQYALYTNERIVPNEYAEPAIYQELEKIREKSKKNLDKKRIMRILRAEGEIANKELKKDEAEE